MKREPDARAETIAALNDLCRRAMGIGGMVFMTHGIASLSTEARSAILGKVARFDRFTEGNDPHGERDFGAIKHDGVFWKIDYYARGDLTRGSECPESAAHTTRVLTIMLAEE
jgi:hypothetical protein